MGEGYKVADGEMLAAAVPFVQVIATAFKASDFPQAQGMALDILADAVGHDFDKLKDCIFESGTLPVGFVMKSLQLLALLVYRAAAAALVMGDEDGEYSDDAQPDPADVIDVLRLICDPSL